MRFGVNSFRDRWPVRFFGSLAAIVIGVPTLTFGSLAYWDTLTSADIAEAVNPTCTPAVYGIVDSGVRYIVEEFTSVGTCDWTAPAGVSAVDYLVVGGGGGGGGGNSGFGNAGGGGGGGEAIESTTEDLSAPLTITVGSGGSGGSGGGSTGASAGTAGGNSSIVTSTSTELATAAGGGGGNRGQYTTGGTGGSGGWSGSRTGGSGPYRHGGGGAGASATGNSGATNGATPQKGGDGGAGLSSSISGVARTYGGGGGGGSPSGAPGLGAAGGGGNGASDTNTIDTDAVAGTDGLGGGGGGGDDANYRPGKKGGSGVVILRYEVPGSTQDRAFAFDTTMSNTSTSEYYEATGNVTDLDADGTIEAWVYFDPDEDAQYAVWGVTRYLYLSTWAQNRTVNGAVLDYPIRVGDNWTTEVEMPQRQWSHIAVTWNGTDASLYINGTIAEQTASFTAPSVDTNGSSPFRVGAIYDNPSTPGDPWAVFWDGNLDEVRVWNDVRTQGEIQSAMHSPASTSDGDLAAYWDFNQIATDSVAALGSVGGDATLTKVGAGEVVSTEFATADTASRSGWTIHKFERSYITTAGGWTVPDAVTAAEVLVVGGGGGGGAWVGAGGGGGGVIENVTALTPGSTEAVRVGHGGLGSRMMATDTVAADDFVEGSDGGSTSFSDLSVLGGGLGATWDQVASSFATAKATGGGGSITSGNGSAGTGSFSNGGTPQNNFQPHLPGGGGGAGGNGSNGGTITNTAGAGGPGLPSDITGSTIRYGGGGGGGAHGTYASPPTCSDCSSVFSGAGTDGGGDGAVLTTGSSRRVGSNGASNRGGGGGGASNFWGPPNSIRSTGGFGGSGVVIVAYPMCTVSAVQSVTIGGIDYRYQEFTTPDTDSTDGSHNGDLSCTDSWTVPSGVASVDVLVVAGGGGGGANSADLVTGGGGGAGGLVLDTVPTTPGDTVSVSVGNGGDGAIWGTDNSGDVGANTVFGSLTAIGGGGGGSLSQSGTAGGSGGGNGYPYSQATSVGAGTAGQGSSGVYFATGNTGGWGGGASGSGQAGIRSSITGSSTSYAMGGAPAVGRGDSAGSTPGSGNGGNAGYDYAAGVDNGQAGSSGTVIVRWVADPADALPVIDLYARYRAGDYDATTKIWADSSGNGRHTVASAVNGTPARTTSTAANGSETTFPIVSGGTGDSLAFPSGVLPGTYTLFHLARYGGTAQQQIFTATNTNWLSGFWDGKSGIAYQALNNSCLAACWITQNTTSEHGSNWVSSTDQPGLYRSQAIDRTTCAGCSTVDTASLAINRPMSVYSTQVSDWQVADLLVFDRQLSTNELRSVEAHLGRSFGVEMPGIQASGVTGSRVNGSGTTATVTWNAPSDVSATGYTIEQSDDDGVSWSTSTVSGSTDPGGTTITGLTSGTSYRFRVFASITEITNEAVSAASSAISTAATSATALSWTPSSPTSADSISLNATVTSGGSPVAGATVAFTADATTISGCGAVTTDANGEATCSWGAQTAGTVSVTATATGDAIVTSSDSQSVAITTGQPGQPTGLRAQPSGSSTTSVVLTWSAPISGATPTDYRIEYSTDRGNNWSTFADGSSTATSVTVTGLTAKIYYTFRVTAIAGSNVGSPSTTSSTVTGLIPFPNASNVGTGATHGFSYLYEDVLDGVDARLTATNVTVSGSGSVDVDTSALDSVFTDGDFINTRLSTSSAHHSVTYRIDFIDAVSGDPVTLENVLISVKDVDGGASSSTSSEYLEVAGITGYTLQSGADIEVSRPSGTSGPYRFRGTNAQSISTVKGWVQVTYDSISSVSLTVGNTTGGFARIPIAFGPVPFTSPVSTSVARPSYTITYNSNGGTGSVPSPTAGTSSLTIADGSGLADGSLSFLRWNTLADGTGTSFASSTSYTPSDDLTLYAIYQRDPAITWSPNVDVPISGSPLTPDATPSRSGNGAISFSVTNAGTTNCTVNPSTGVLTFTAVGSCTVRATVAASGDFAADSIDVAFVISAVTQSITFTEPADRVWSESSFTLSPSTDATGLNVVLGSDTTAVCTVSGSVAPFTVTMLRTGVCTLTASQEGNSTYAAATPVSRSFEITGASNAITFAPTFPSTTYGDDSFSIAGTSSSDLVLEFSTSTPRVCSVSGDSALTNGATNAVVTPIGAGTCTITAAQPGDEQYAEATSVERSFTIGKSAQSTLVFTSLSSGVWGDSFTAAISGGSGSGLVTFSATTGSAGCTVNPTTGIVTYTSAGTCDVSADKASDANYLAAEQATQTITISKATQTVSFTSTVPTNPRPGGTYSLAAASTSGLVPTFTISAGQTNVCTLSGGVVTFVATGTCSISAAQAGDSRFSAATTQSQTISVGSLNQTITVESVDDIDFGAPAFALEAEATSGLVLAVASTDTEVCTVSGLVVTPLDIGTCEITFTQTGDARYAAASPVSSSFRILAALPTAPSIVSVSGGNAEITIGFTAPGFTGGVPISAYEITASPTSGDDVVDRSCDESPCTITGLTNGTAYTLTVAAINSAGTSPTSELSPSVTPATRATAVRQLNATPGNGTMSVAWTAPTDLGGGTFTRYELRIAPDGDAMPDAATANITSSSSGVYTFTGLDNGTAYNVEIVTITSANQTALTGNTASLSSVPVSTPSTPTELRVSSINPRQITIAWSEPLRDGGATVTGYVATISDVDGGTVNCGTLNINTTTRSATCTSEQLGLSTSYTITVSAVNRIGLGPAATTTHTTPTFTAPTTPPVTTEDDDYANVDCPCILDPNGNPTPVETSTTAVGRIPGGSTITVGSGTIGLGGQATSGSATTWVDVNGNFVAQTPGAIPLTGSGALPGTVVTVFLGGKVIGTATVDADGMWSLNLELPDGTSGQINISLVWIDENGTQNSLVVPITINATGDAAIAPRSPAGGAQLAPDPDSALALGPNGEVLDSVRSNDPEANSISVIADNTTFTVTPAQNGQVATNGRLTLTHPARVRVTGNGMLPGATATIWIKSDPQRLGSITITADGVLDATFAVPTSIDPGNHTIQIDTTDPNGEALTLALGLTITDGLLPVTGSNTNLEWVILFIALGGLVMLSTGSRRRQLQ